MGNVNTVFENKCQICKVFGIQKGNASVIRARWI